MHKLLIWGRENGKYNHAVFMCDSEDDIEQIDMSKCAVGSIVYFVDKNDSNKMKKYILTPSRELVEFNDDDPSSSPVDIDIATTSETSSYLNI